MRILQTVFLTLLLLSLAACQTSNKYTTNVESKKDSNSLNLDIPYEQFILDNGLTVILHEDHSDPIVALATIVHVGSNREKPGRTGFAHFFEHMAFNNSENVPMGANRKMIPELGGTRNGGTWSDGTQYYEVVPKDAFEKLMWIDSDRFGYMINTVTQGTLEREKQVVKNEKRQRVDNRAYGHTGHVIKKALYPKSHPYNWTVIGDLEDLQNATLDDVREFYDEFYIPANATLVIAGDIDIAKTKSLVEKWFGEIKKSPAIPDLPAQPVTLTETIKRYHIDSFAKLPELRITFPTVEQYHPDSYALDALAKILSDGKKSPLFTTLVEKNKQAPAVYAYQRSNELAGTFTIHIRANADVDLDDVYQSIVESLIKFEKEGVRENDLIKIKASQEINFYNGISSILNKAFQLGIYNEFAGDPAYIKKDIENILAVTKDDVVRVFNKYIKNQPAIITSFVPKENVSLIVDGSEKANIVEEEITQGLEEKFEEDLNPIFTLTPSKYDRTEPPLSELPTKSIPSIWHNKTNNGINIVGIEQHELPLINFSLRIEAGRILDDHDKLGTASLLAQMMNEGTEFKTPIELEDAIGLLGSRIYVGSSATSLVIAGNTLQRNYQKTMDLVTEILLHPRFNQADFNRLKTKQLTSIKSDLANPNTVARNVFYRKIYGDNHVYGQKSSGSSKTVTNIKLEDIKSYYKNNLILANTSFRIVGSYKPKEVMSSLATINDTWKTPNEVKFPTMPKIQLVNSPKVYFIDIPGAKQSALFVGKPTINAQHNDANRLDIVNTPLGGGMSARLGQILRIQKGYTYGAYSYIDNNNIHGTFVASSQVRSNVTLESLKIIQQQFKEFHHALSKEELEITKNKIIKGNSRKFETLRQLLSIASDIDYYHYSDDYLQQHQIELESMTLKEAKSIIQSNLNEQQMIYVIAGDAKTQFARVKDLGYGEPILLDRLGNEIH